MFIFVFVNKWCDMLQYFKNFFYNGKKLGFVVVFCGFSLAVFFYCRLLTGSTSSGFFGAKSMLVF